MDEFPTDERTQAAKEDLLSTDPGRAWSGISRGPRPAAEGVRIIGAEEAAAAIESGQVSPRVPEDAPRFGDVPKSPPGPHPPLRFPGTDPSAVAKPPVVIPEAPPPPAPPPPAAAAPVSPGPSWSAAFDSQPQATDDPGGFWDPPVVATAPPGRFEELVAAAAKAEAEAGGPEPSGHPSFEPELREISPDRPLTSDPVSGEWAVASGLGGNVGPPAQAGRNLTAPSRGPESPPSDWDRLTGTSSGRRPVSEGDRGSWQFFDESEEGQTARPAPAAPPPSQDSGSVSLPHWTDPPTGEVPRLLADGGPPTTAAPTTNDDDELSAWSALSTGPRWRDQPADWDDADFSDTVLDDREARLGALRDQPDEEGDLFAFEDAVAPAPPAQVTGRGRGTATQVRRTSGRRRPGRGPGGLPPGGPAGPGGPGGPGGGGGGGGGGPADISTRVVTGVIAAGVLLAAAAIGPRALIVLVVATVTMAAHPTRPRRVAGW